MNIYDRLYDTSKINYGNIKSGRYASQREIELLEEICSLIQTFKISDTAQVLEIGAHLGFNHKCHNNYLGIEYSKYAVDEARKRFGEDVPIIVGDATDLTVKSDSIDFLFTYATLEHIPKIENALNEIMRVLKKDGIAYLAPAWNCRIWTVEKLDCLPYSELNNIKKIQKFFIPLRENLIYRFLFSMPLRFLDEIKLFTKKKYYLRYKKLPVNIELIERFGHTADDDAYINVDAHSAVVWFKSRGFDILSHPTFLSRFFCRGDPVIIQKK